MLNEAASFLIETKYPQRELRGERVRRLLRLLHQQHLPRAFDGEIQAALIMRGQAGVFARENPSLVGDELAEQRDVFEFQRVGGEINFGFGTGRAAFG
jgi:hypothetical protein